MLIIEPKIIEMHDIEKDKITYYNNYFGYRYTLLLILFFNIDILTSGTVSSKARAPLLKLKLALLFEQSRSHILIQQGLLSGKSLE
jgi:hypothetical protein